ncbi:recombinase family protein [uncultured Robinsoniella sp.]|uniref:recombinase family protein n=1 Tax=uncultured Robinsoniella sp. TaxID=904190 RepID=UPI00374F25F4
MTPEQSRPAIRCALYIRVSSSEQAMHGKSLEAQKMYLEEHAVKNSYEIAGIYADEGKTARKELKKRKAIHALLESVKREEIDVILFWKMDRWFRNVSDFYKVQEILDQHHVKWFAVAEPNMNLDTRDGRLNLNIMLSIGQNEVDTTSERIKFVNEASVSQGRLIFGKYSMPYGYTSQNINGMKRMVIDKDKERIVQEWARFFQMSQSKRSTVEYIRTNFDEAFTYDIMNSMLKSDFYIGKYRNNATYCEPYFSSETWSKIQNAANRNVRKPVGERVYLFTGLIKCPFCGRSLSASYTTRILYKKTGAKKTYVYYRCSYGTNNKLHKINPLNESKIENYLLEYLRKVYAGYKARCLSIDALKKPKPSANPEKIRKEIERLNFLFQKSRISQEKYENEYSCLIKQLRETEQISSESQPVKNMSELETVINCGFHEIYGRLGRQGKQRFWHHLIKEIIINQKNEIVSVEFNYI